MKHAIGLVPIALAGGIQMSIFSYTPIRAAITLVLLAIGIYCYDGLVLKHMDTVDELDWLKQRTSAQEPPQAKIPKEG